MANHGVTCTASIVALAFEQLYYFERAAQTVLPARGSGQPLRVMPDEIAARTALGWKDYVDKADAHFEHLKTGLDGIDPSYRS